MNIIHACWNTIASGQGPKTKGKWPDCAMSRLVCVFFGNKGTTRFSYDGAHVSQKPYLSTTSRHLKLFLYFVNFASYFFWLHLVSSLNGFYGNEIKSYSYTHVYEGELEIILLENRGISFAKRKLISIQLKMPSIRFNVMKTPYCKKITSASG